MTMLELLANLSLTAHGPVNTAATSLMGSVKGRFRVGIR